MKNLSTFASVPCQILQHNFLLLFSNQEKKGNATNCTCMESVCANKNDTDDDDPDDADVASQVQQYCYTHDKADVEAVLAKMAVVCPHLWRSLTVATHSADIGPNHQKPSWCKCGKCYEETDPKDQVCCKKITNTHHLK
jgi:hypothetical protein